jgi:hypothetical protein
MTSCLTDDDLYAWASLSAAHTSEDRARLDLLLAHIERCEACRVLAAAALPATLRDRALVGRYQLGMAIDPQHVEAVELRGGREVVLRIVQANADDEADLQRLARLRSPHLVRVLDAGTLPDSRMYIACERDEASAVDVWIETEEPSREDILDVLTQALDGLRDAHASGLVHGALSARFIRVDEKRRARVSELGLAAIERPANLPGPSSLWAVAPEVLDGGEPTALSDQFSFAALAFQLLTRREPFEGATTKAVRVSMTRGVTDGPLSALPGYVQRALRKALQADPKKRFASTQDFLLDLRNETKVQRAAPLFAVGGVAVLGVIGAVGYFSAQKPVEAPPRQSPICGELAQEFKLLWGDAQSEMLAAHVKKVAPAAHDELMPALRTVFDDRLRVGEDARAQLCEGRIVREEEARCMRWRNLETRVFFDTLLETSNPVALTQAVEAAEALTPPETCMGAKVIEYDQGVARQAIRAAVLVGMGEPAPVLDVKASEQELERSLPEAVWLLTRQQAETWDGILEPVRDAPARHPLYMERQQALRDAFAEHAFATDAPGASGAPGAPGAPSKGRSPRDAADAGTVIADAGGGNRAGDAAIDAATVGEADGGTADETDWGRGGPRDLALMRAAKIGEATGVDAYAMRARAMRVHVLGAIAHSDFEAPRLLAETRRHLWTAGQVEAQRIRWLTQQWNLPTSAYYRSCAEDRQAESGALCASVFPAYHDATWDVPEESAQIWLVSIGKALGVPNRGAAHALVALSEARLAHGKLDDAKESAEAAQTLLSDRLARNTSTWFGALGSGGARLTKGHPVALLPDRILLEVELLSRAIAVLAIISGDPASAEAAEQAYVALGDDARVRFAPAFARAYLAWNKKDTERTLALAEEASTLASLAKRPGYVARANALLVMAANVSKRRDEVFQAALAQALPSVAFMLPVERVKVRTLAAREFERSKPGLARQFAEQAFSEGNVEQRKELEDLLSRLRR